MDLKEQLITAKDLAVQAGKKILEIYNSKSLDITKKEDGSPLTKADIYANKIIVSGLRERFPEYSILTEEERDNKERLKNDYVWIIDPLDGTKEFISRNGEFTVNIALAYKRDPVIGVIYVPVTGELFFASRGNGAYWKNGNVKRIHVSERDEIKDMILIKSRSHPSKKLNDLLNKYKFAKIKTKGSSLKGCAVAKGDADVYFRFGCVNEWDVCAMDCIVRESGGIMTDLDGKVLKYNSNDVLIKGFVVSNNKIHNKLLDMQKGI